MSPLTTALFRAEQRPPEIWLMIWKMVAVAIDQEYESTDFHHWLNDHGPPFYGDVDRQLREDPMRRREKLIFAAAYSAALEEYGPRLYEHVVLISRGGVAAMLDCAMKSTLRITQLSSRRALWVKHIDLILSDLESTEFDWGVTQQAWSAFHHLETLTICYYPKEPAPLKTYCPIAAHLPPSMKLLRLRPWGEADSVPPQFPQWLKGGKKGKILGLRQDFWWRDSWAEHVKAFQNVPNIHLQAVVYVVWPPFSGQAAEKAFRPWTALVDGGRLHNISVTLFLPNEGLAIHDAVQELPGDRDVLSEGKRYGYFPPDMESVDDSLDDILLYDWRINKDGDWEVDMTGKTASYWVSDYGRFSYAVAGQVDYLQEWGWYASMQ